MKRKGKGGGDVYKEQGWLVDLDEVWGKRKGGSTYLTSRSFSSWLSSSHHGCSRHVARCLCCYLGVKMPCESVSVCGMMLGRRGPLGNGHNGRAGCYRYIVQVGVIL